MAIPQGRLQSELAQFTKGDRVELHPGTDAWMMGDRYGNVVYIGRKHIHVLMDRSNKIRKLHPSNVMPI